MSVLRRINSSHHARSGGSILSIQDVVDDGVFTAHLKSLSLASWGVVTKRPCVDRLQEKLELCVAELQELHNSNIWNLFETTSELIQRLTNSLDSVKNVLHQESTSSDMSASEGDISLNDLLLIDLSQKEVSDWEAKISREVGEAIGEKLEREVLVPINAIGSLGANDAGEQIVEFAELEKRLEEIQSITSGRQFDSLETISRLIDRLVLVRGLIGKLVTTLNQCLEELSHLEHLKSDDALAVAKFSNFDPMLTEFFDLLSSQTPNTRPQAVVLAEVFYRSCKLFLGDATSAIGSQRELGRLLNHLEKLGYSEDDINSVLSLSWNSLNQIIAKSADHYTERPEDINIKVLMAALVYSICDGISNILRSSGLTGLYNAFGITNPNISYGLVMLNPTATTDQFIEMPGCEQIIYPEGFHAVIKRIVHSETTKLTGQEIDCLRQALEPALKDKLPTGASVDKTVETVILIVDDVISILLEKKVENEKIEKLLLKKGFWSAVIEGALVIENDSRGSKFERLLTEKICDEVLKSLDSTNQSVEIGPHIIREFMTDWGRRIGSEEDLDSHE